LKILLITDETRLSSIDVRRLSYFADPSDIEVRYGFESGMEFIQNYAIRDQMHIDFILVSRQKRQTFWDDFYFENSRIDEFAIWLRGLKENYSCENFRVSSIPLILDDEETLHRSQFISGFKSNDYDLITNLKYIRDDLISQIIGQPINRWLNQLGDELDRADLDTKFDFASSLVPKKDSFDTDILSQSFFSRYRRLNYAWIGDNIKKLYVDIDEFKKLLDKSDKYKNLRNEKEDYHTFLRKYTGLFLGDQYVSTIYENHFYYSMSKKYVEPDFLNIQYPHSSYLPQVFEIKLPNQRISNSTGHEASGYFKKSANQVGSKYVNYFTNLRENSGQINKGLNKSNFNTSPVGCISKIHGHHAAILNSVWTSLITSPH
jgi:hypothetical protein